MITKTSAFVSIVLTEPMLGTVAKDENAFKDIFEPKAPKGNVPEEEETAPLELEAKGWTGFHSDDKGLFVYDYMIRGFLKNAGNILKDDVKIKNLKSKINNFCFIFPRRIYFKKNGQYIKEPAQNFDRPIQGMTKQGPRISIIRSDLVNEGTELEFKLELLNHKEIKIDLFRELLEYGKYCGLGQWRNGSFGRFEVTDFTVESGGIDK